MQVCSREGETKHWCCVQDLCQWCRQEHMSMSLVRGLSHMHGHGAINPSHLPTGTTLLP